MKKSICGISCDKCELKQDCGGCAETNGQPFGGDCVVASCFLKKENKVCERCDLDNCNLKKQIVNQFNALNVEGLGKIQDLNLLKGSYVNLEYNLPSSNTIKFWDDDKIYFANQIETKNSNKCFGLTADKNHLLVCEYGENGSNPQIIVFKKWR